MNRLGTHGDGLINFKRLPKIPPADTTAELKFPLSGILCQLRQKFGWKYSDYSTVVDMRWWCSSEWRDARGCHSLLKASLVIVLHHGLDSTELDSAFWAYLYPNPFSGFSLEELRCQKLNTIWQRNLEKKFRQKILIFICCALIRLEQIGDMNILGRWGCVMRREVWEKWRVFLPEQLWCCISWRFQNTPWFLVWNMPLVMANLGCQLTHLGRGDLSWGLASIRLACEPFFFSLLIDI